MIGVAERICVRDQRFNVAIKAYSFFNIIDLINSNSADFAAAIPGSNIRVFKSGIFPN